MVRLFLLRILLFSVLPALASSADRRTVALLDCTTRNSETNDGELFSAEHLLKVAGIPYIKTTDVNTAIGYGMIITSSRLQSTTLLQSERDSLYSYVYYGGILFAPIVTDVALYNLFGITGVQTSTTRYTMRFDTLAANAECRWLDDTAEVKISLGRSTYLNIFTTRSYSVLSAQGIGHYEDSSIALTRRQYGTGKAYALGFSFKNVIQTNLLNNDYDAQRVYSNGFEPTTDAIILFVKGIYTTHTPYSAWLHTSPYSSRSTLMITHDVDATSAFDTMNYYADYEYGMGIRATYLITTHYINDDWLSDFYNVTSIPKVQYVLTRGHVLGSHSVGHFPDFDDETIFPLGNPGNSTITYQPYYPSNGPTAGGSVFGETEVSRDLLLVDCGVTVHTFRSGYLAYNDKMINALDTLGYHFNSTSAAPDLLTNFPFRARFDRSSSGILSQKVWEVPMVISDVFSSDPITESNYPQKVAVWLDVIRRNQANFAPSVLLIHPNRMFKLSAQMSLVSQLPQNIFICPLEIYGDFWRSRDSVQFSTELLGADTLLITIPSALLPLNNMMSFIVDNGQDLAQLQLKDDLGNPLAFLQSPWEDNDLIVYFAAPPVLSGMGQSAATGYFSSTLYPNPSNGDVTIEFTCPGKSDVRVNLFDLSGRFLRSLAGGSFDPGRHAVRADLAGLEAGTYLYSVENERRREVKKLVILR